MVISGSIVIAINQSVFHPTFGNLQAYEHNKRYPQYLFLFYGWYIDKWWIGTEEDQKYLHKLYPNCTSEHIASILPYSLAPLRAEFLSDQNESTIIDSGIVSY